MEEIKTLHQKVLKKVRKLDLEKVKPYLKHISEGSLNDIKSEDGRSDYYKYLTCLMETVKPKQVVELGGAMGASVLMMLAGLPKSSKLYSITLEEHGLEFSFVKKDYPQFTPVIGNDLNLSVWPDELDLGKTDVWFIDTEHFAYQLRYELMLYRPFFKKRALVLVDDIYKNDMYEAWLEIRHEKIDVSELHWSGFGIFKT